MGKIKNIDHWKDRLMMYEHMPEQMMALEGLTEEQLYETIADLKQKIEYSKRGKSSKRKGAGYENTIAKKFLEKWGIRLVRTPSSGGFQKSEDNETLRGDLASVDKNVRVLLHIECKNQKTWKLKDWWKQATEDCPSDNVPIVVFHQNQEIKDGKRVQEADDFIMIRVTDFLAITDVDKVVKKKGMKRDESKRRNMCPSGIKEVKRKRIIPRIKQSH